MKLTTMIAGGALALALTAPAQAQTLLTGADTDEILNAARGYGAATLSTQSNGDPQINGKINGISYQVYFRNCTNNTDCEDLNFYVGFLDLKPTLEVINDWNFNKRFSRAYLDQDQDACVEMDLDMVKGVTAEYLDSQFGLWSMVVDQYSEHVGYGL
ncbi:YbjN domain-containing protein [Devosia lacusdianchii]|uniref:YbjN domain-containing protein n=1 Tax=Devosia lacusdianchii TaxID=2917991 RepID=UPI001F0630D2|nr:YbjN domain-containing protein [Devosia sp. JXJ CY 41]